MDIENDIHQGVEARIRSYTHVTQHNNLVFVPLLYHHPLINRSLLTQEQDKFRFHKEKRKIKNIKVKTKVIPCRGIEAYLPQRNGALIAHNVAPHKPRLWLACSDLRILLWFWNLKKIKSLMQMGRYKVQSPCSQRHLSPSLITITSSGVSA